jgi:hypothetical protein
LRKEYEFKIFRLNDSCRNSFSSRCSIRDFGDNIDYEYSQRKRDGFIKHHQRFTEVAKKKSRNAPLCGEKKPNKNKASQFANEINEEFKCGPTYYDSTLYEEI